MIRRRRIRDEDKRLDEDELSSAHSAGKMAGVGNGSLAGCRWIEETRDRHPAELMECGKSDERGWWERVYKRGEMCWCETK